jgi:DNA-directed RNA polymerases I, II, and III subunit RPABC4
MSSTPASTTNSRDAYTLPAAPAPRSAHPPSSSSQQRTPTTATSTAAASSSAATAAKQYTTSYGVATHEASAGPQTQYVCGDCNTKVRLGRGDAIRCSTCGHRVLYKERTRRMVQFEAR